MLQHAIQISPRFSDYNVQGLLKWSLHFDFVCEAQLAQFTTRYGIRFAKYQEVGQRWNIKNYQINMHEDNAWLMQPIWVVTDITKLSGSNQFVEFSFWNSDQTLKYASGSIQFELFDMKKQVSIAISEDDKMLFQKN